MSLKLATEKTIWGTVKSQKYAKANVFNFTLSGERPDQILWLKRRKEEHWVLMKQVFGDYRIAVVQLPFLNHCFYTVIYTHDDSWKVVDRLLFPHGFARKSFAEMMRFEHDVQDVKEYYRLQRENLVL